MSVELIFFFCIFTQFRAYFVILTMAIVVTETSEIFSMIISSMLIFPCFPVNSLYL